MNKDGALTCIFHFLIGPRNVNIALSTTDDSEVKVSPKSIVIKSDNDYNRRRKVVVTGVDDDMADGDQFVSVKPK